MAAACTSDETESFVTCSICLCEYDVEVRKPKFLPCSHTLCLKCLKEIHKDFVITCPLCRKSFTHQEDVTSLPNNPYALHLLKISEKSVDTVTNKQDVARKSASQWCLTCGAMAKGDCSLHSTIDVTTNTIKNFESLLKLRENIKKMRDEGQTKLALAIEKRKEIQAHLTQVSLSLTMALNEVKKQEEINNLRLVEMVSQLEGSSPHLRPVSKNQTEGQEDPFLMELISLVDDAKPEDSIDTLKEKMSKSVQSCERKLSLATDMAKELKDQKKSRISVRVTDDKNKSVPTWELLESGFNTYWPGDTSLTPTKRDFLLLSHIVFSIQKRGMNINKQHSTLLDEPSQQLRPATSLTKVNTAPEEERPDENPTVISSPTVEKFDLNKSILIITVRRFGLMKGKLNIKLSPSCDSPFIQQLGKMCFRSPQQFSDMIGKAIAGVFLLVPVFQDFAEFRYDELKSLPRARHYSEVGISLWVDEKGKVGGWSFVFPLQHFQDRKNEVHRKSVEPVYFIGHVTQGIDIVDMLSWTTKHQRNGYTFMLESR